MEEGSIHYLNLHFAINEMVLYHIGKIMSLFLDVGSADGHN